MKIWNSTNNTTYLTNHKNKDKEHLHHFKVSKVHFQRPLMIGFQYTFTFTFFQVFL